MINVSAKSVFEILQGLYLIPEPSVVYSFRWWYFLADSTIVFFFERLTSDSRGFPTNPPHCAIFEIWFLKKFLTKCEVLI